MSATEPTIIRLDTSEKVAFSPDSYYQPIINVGDQTLRLLGTHMSSKRVVNYTDGDTMVMK
jgi:hypothetical protein